MKGIYMIRDPSGKVVSAKDMNRDINTFRSKMKAKEYRNNLSKAHGHSKDLITMGKAYTVSKGPGHWKNT